MASSSTSTGSTAASESELSVSQPDETTATEDHDEMTDSAEDQQPEQDTRKLKTRFSGAAKYHTR